MVAVARVLEGERRPDDDGVVKGARIPEADGDPTSSAGDRRGRAERRHEQAARQCRRASTLRHQHQSVKRATYERRYRQTVRRIDIWSVLKVALCFYLCALIVVLVAGVMLWLVADAFGVIHNIEQFFGDLFDDKGFHFLSSEILRAATVVGLVFVCLMTMWTVLAAAFYNLFAELIGGIEVDVSRRAEHEEALGVDHGALVRSSPSAGL